MADNELAVILRAAVGDFVGGMNRAKAEVTQFGELAVSTFDQVEEASENLSHVWKSLFEAFIGVEIIDGLKKIADAADDAALRMNTAAQSAKNFGKAFDSTSMEQWVEKFARSAQGGGYAINDMRDAVERFAAVGQDGAQTQRALADTANLAASRSISFAQAAQIVEYALTGHVDMLTRYGIVTREAAKNIHTVEQAMEALEKSTAGDAEKRMNSLAGAFGRLGTSITLLGESFGKYLIPYFDAAANGITHVADAFAALPPWLQQAVAGFSAVSLSLMTLGLLLPATVKAAAFLANGFQILRAGALLLVGGMRTVALTAEETRGVLLQLQAGTITAEAAQEALAGKTIKVKGAFGLLNDLIIGPIRSAFAGFVSMIRTAVVWLGTDLVGAEGAAALGASEFIAPVLAVAAAIAGLIAVVVLLTGHWHDAMKFLNTAWDEFYKNILTKGDAIRRVLQDVALALNPATSTMGIALLGAELGTDMPKTSSAVSAGVSASIDWLKKQLAGVVGDIKGFFGLISSSVSVPNPPFAGDIPGKGGKAAKSRASHVGKTPDGKGEATIYFAYPKLPMLSLGELESQREDIRHQKAMAEAAGKLTPTLSAQYDAQAAAIDEQIAKIKEANAERAVENARIKEKNAEPNSAAAQAAAAELTRAQAALTQSQVNLRVASDKAAESLTKLQHTEAQRGDGNKSILAQLAGRAGIPIGANGGLDWASVLMKAVEQSHAFADIMSVVNQIMRVFSQIIDALRPVIDMLLKAVIAVVNGFIDVWNVLAKILRVFGIHLELLKKINGIYGSSPFMDIVHDIPTLNELASGHVAPLYPSGVNDTIVNGITGPINDQLKDQSLGGGILGVLGEILGAILALKLAMGVLGLSGSGGGLFGFISDVAKFFTHSSVASSVQDGVTGALADSAVTGDMGTLTTGVSDGLQQAAASLQTVPGVSSAASAASGGGGGVFGHLGAFLGGTHIGAATLGSTLLAVAGGAVIGNFMGKLFGGGTHSTFGALGGALGAGLGATLGMFGLAAGPLGALAGAGIGALIGSLFGHSENPANMPDEFNPNEWGQDNANLWGAGFSGENAMHVKGQNPFTMDPRLAQMTGGKGLLQFLASYIASTGGKGLTAAQIKEFTGLDVFSPVTGGKNGTLDLANGIKEQWQQLYSDATSAFQTIAQGTSGMWNAFTGVVGNVIEVAGNVVRFVDSSTNDLANQVSQSSAAAASLVAAATRSAPISSTPSPGAVRSVTSGAQHAAPIYITGDNHFYNDTDIDELGKRLTLAQLRNARTNAYRIDRDGVPS